MKQVWETPGLAPGQPLGLPSPALVPLCRLACSQHPALPIDHGQPPPSQHAPALTTLPPPPGSSAPLLHPLPRDSSPTDLLSMLLRCGLFTTHTDIEPNQNEGGFRQGLQYFLALSAFPCPKLGEGASGVSYLETGSLQEWVRSSLAVFSAIY